MIVVLQSVTLLETSCRVFTVMLFTSNASSPAERSTPRLPKCGFGSLRPQTCVIKSVGVAGRVSGQEK